MYLTMLAGLTMNGDVVSEWSTVEHSDDDMALSSEQEILEVPELTDDLLDTLDSENYDDEQPSSGPQTGQPGTSVECNICERTVKVRKDGLLATHKCEPKAQRGNRLDHLPDRRSTTPTKTRDFLITIGAWAVEESTARVLARPFGADPDDVPSNLPDAEGMLGPPIDLLWPTLPEGARKFVAACADNSDLIACALAWGDWMRTLSTWMREQRAFQRQLIEQEKQNAPTQFARTDDFPRVVPFTPA